MILIIFVRIRSIFISTSYVGTIYKTNRVDVVPVVGHELVSLRQLSQDTSIISICTID
jgi:hypothetical protein